MSHSMGAIRAAEVITGDAYLGKKRRIRTANGLKTTEGIADLIDNETGAARMLKIVKFIAGWADNGGDSISLSTLVTDVDDGDDETLTLEKACRKVLDSIARCSN